MSDRRDEGVAASMDGATGAPEVTRDTIVEVVAQLLAEHGEHGLRIRDVAEHAGVSVGTIYYHFGGREGLIEAVRQQQIVDFIATSFLNHIDEAPALITNAAGIDEVLVGFDPIIGPLLDASAAPRRAEVAAVLGSAMARADLLVLLRRRVTEVLDLHTGIARLLANRGWLHDDVDPRMLVVFLHALALGRIIGDLDEEPFDDAAWFGIFDRAIRSLVRLDD